MRMLKIIRAAQPSRLFFAVFITFALTSLAGEAASLKKIKARGYLNIATEDNYAPFEIMKGGKASGFTNDVVAELKKYADFKIRQDILPWSGLLASVRAGKYDCAITGSIISEERLRVFDFAMPTASAQHYYITRKKENRIKGIKDLNGLTVGVQAGSVLLSRLPELGAMLEKTGGKLGKVVEYTSYPEIYEDLANGRLDYTVNAIVGAKNLISKRGDTLVGAAENFTMFRADVTIMNDQTDEIMRQHRVLGVPTYLFFDRDGAEAERLVGFVSSEEFLRAMKAASVTLPGSS